MRWIRGCGYKNNPARDHGGLTGVGICRITLRGATVSQLEDDERREIYRLQPRDDQKPTLVISGESMRAVPDEITDINVRGIKIEFDSDNAPHLLPGREVTVNLSAPGFTGIATIAARIVFAAKRGAKVIAALVFVKLPEAVARASSEFFSIFNRRSNRRSESAPGRSPRLAEVVATATQSRHEATVDNYSGSGVGLVVDAAVDRLLRLSKEFEIVLRFPRSSEVRRVTARIVRRVPGASETYYGCVLIGGV